MKYNLFLDDIRHPDNAYAYTGFNAFINETWSIVRNYNEFVSLITRRGLPEFISFDHDLADIHYNPKTWTENFVYDEETGLDCAKWLIDYCMDNNLKLPPFFVHSQNPVGRKNINSLLDQFREFQENEKNT